MRNFIRAALPFVPALTLMALIFAFSAMPSDGTDKGLLVFLLRKLAHFSEYFVLTGLWWWALSTKIDARTAVGVALAISIAYAITDEWHQTFVDGRTGTWRDVIIDSAGAVTAAAVIRARASRVLSR